MENNLAIEIKNLSFGYVGDWTMKRTNNLKNINLEIFEKESFGFLGQNGAGKSTTIKCILDLLRPNSGEIKIFGKPSTELSSRLNVGYVAEQPYFYDYIKVNETLEMAATLIGIDRRDIKQSVASALDLAGISYKANSAMRSLSKGQTQRVAIAQAIIGKPKLLILDEPFSGLDPVGRKEICDLFFQLKEQGTTIFICSHILSDIEFLCDRVSVMAKGELLGVYKLSDLPRLKEGDYELIISNYQGLQELLLPLANQVKEQDLFLRLKFSNIDNAKRALQIALGSDAHIESYSFMHSTLEELFVSLVQGAK